MKLVVASVCGLTSGGLGGPQGGDGGDLGDENP